MRRNTNFQVGGRSWGVWQAPCPVEAGDSHQQRGQGGLLTGSHIIGAQALAAWLGVSSPTQVWEGRNISAREKADTQAGSRRGPGPGQGTGAPRGAVKAEEHAPTGGKAQSQHRDPAAGPQETG